MLAERAEGARVQVGGVVLGGVGGGLGVALAEGAVFEFLELEAEAGCLGLGLWEEVGGSLGGGVILVVVL